MGRDMSEEYAALPGPVQINGKTYIPILSDTYGCVRCEGKDICQDLPRCWNNNTDQDWYYVVKEPKHGHCSELPSQTRSFLRHCGLPESCGYGWTPMPPANQKLVNLQGLYSWSAKNI